MFEQLQTGTLLQGGIYKIEYLYKRGGQAFIYLATHQNLEQRVIIKQTKINNEFSEAIKEEGKILFNLEHPSLPKITNLFEENGMLFLVMNFISGNDLGLLLRQNRKPFPFPWAVNWLIQLLEILEYLQSCTPSIIHRDINPGNIRLGETNKIYLLDFGIAKKTGFEHLLKGGTDSYISPEQFRDTNIDFRSDIYSTSATFYHLLTNKKPVSAIKREEQIQSGGTDPLIPILQLNSEVPFTLSNLLLAGMDLNPGDRPQNAAEMKNLLLRSEDTFYQTDQISEVTEVRLQDASRILVEFEKKEAEISQSCILSSSEWIEEIDKIEENSEASRLLFCLVDLIDASVEKKVKMKERFISLTGNRIKNDLQLNIILEIMNYIIQNPNNDIEVKIRERIVSRWENSKKFHKTSQGKDIKLGRQHLIFAIRVFLIVSVFILLYLIYYLLLI